MSSKEKVDRNRRDPATMTSQKRDRMVERIWVNQKGKMV